MSLYDPVANDLCSYRIKKNLLSIALVFWDVDMSIEAVDPTVHYPQSGVIPFRMVHGEIEVLLITTNSRKHWTIPKGLSDILDQIESVIQNINTHPTNSHSSAGK